MYKEIMIPAFLNPSSIDDLNRQLALAEKEQVRFVVVKGSEAVFCNGLDLVWVIRNEQADYLTEMRAYGAFLKNLQAGPFISIAMISGSVSGGGMGIVCACDYVITSTASTFSLPEGLLGLIPGMIMPSLLHRISPQRVKKMVFTGQKYSSEQACEWGIVDERVSDTELEARLKELMQTMKSCKKDSVTDLKSILYHAPVQKEILAQQGMDMLSGRLKEPEIRQRLEALVDFMGE